MSGCCTCYTNKDELRNQQASDAARGSPRYNQRLRPALLRHLRQVSAPDVGGRPGRGVHGGCPRGVDALLPLHHARDAGRLQDIHAGDRRGGTDARGRSAAAIATKQASCQRVGSIE